MKAIKPYTYVGPAFGSRFFDDLFEDFSALNGSQKKFPACDLGEFENHFLITMDIPGVKKNDLIIDLKNRNLSVSGKRMDIDKNAKINKNERWTGEFTRVFTLPEDADIDKIEAHHEDGVLQIAIPKAKETESRKIEVSSDEKKDGFFSKFLKSND